MLALACIAAAGLASEGRMLTLGSSALKGASELKFFGEAFEYAMQDIEFEKRCGIATDAPPTDEPTTEEATTAEPYDVPCENAAGGGPCITCDNGATPTFAAADLTFGGMVVDSDGPTGGAHETFFWGAGETKYSTVKAPLTYRRDVNPSSGSLMYIVQLSHPLVRDYSMRTAKVYVWTRLQSWMPDRKELHTTVNAEDTSIKIIKEDDDTNAPRKSDTIALHAGDIAINRTVVGVTQFAAANGDAYWEVELDEKIGHDFSPGPDTHVKLHETSPERNTDLGDSGSSGLSGGALGGIIGGSIGGVLLIAVAVRKSMPGKTSSLDGV